MCAPQQKLILLPHVRNGWKALLNASVRNGSKTDTSGLASRPSLAPFCTRARLTPAALRHSLRVGRRASPTPRSSDCDFHVLCRSRTSGECRLLRHTLPDSSLSLREGGEGFAPGVCECPRPDEARPPLINLQTMSDICALTSAGRASLLLLIVCKGSMSGPSRKPTACAAFAR